MADPEPEHGHPHNHQHGGPNSLGSAFANLRGTGLPWRQVLALVASNVRLKVVSLRGCCGNYGQPGC